jgi:hypothetical protein
MPRCRAIDQIAAISHGSPAICTGMIAFVRPVIRLAISSGSMLPSHPISASTGVAPTCKIVCTVAQNVIGVVMTSSPGPMPSAASATCNPAVAELTATACGPPVYSWKSRSKRAVRGPVVSHPDLSVSTTSLISSSPIEGR